MDGTVIPLEEGASWERDISLFREAVDAKRDLCLAYVTGRDLAKALSGIEEYRLPEPDLLVSDVGTSLFHAYGGGYRLDEGYAQKMHEALGGLQAEEIRARAAPLPGLELQPEDRQTPFKVSYFLPPGRDHSSVLASLRDHLGIFKGRVQVVYSVQAQDGTGLVDLLPAGVAKDFALRYLQGITGVEADRLVYAGDSGNDLAALFAGFKAIVVGNADETLKKQVREKAEEDGILCRIYFSEKHYAGGVLEGCAHFGIL
jgi:sucrose-6F-phosphate phosphohydrolase